MSQSMEAPELSAGEQSALAWAAYSEWEQSVARVVGDVLDVDPVTITGWYADDLTPEHAAERYEALNHPR